MPAYRFILRRGPASAVATDVPMAGELLLDTESRTVTVGDGATPGGLALHKASVGLGNVSNDAQLKASQLETDPSLASDLDTRVPSTKAVRAYVAANGGGGGGALSLDTLVTSLQPTAWYRADDGALDAGGSACSDAAAIATWQDRSGGGWHLGQTTSGYRPTWRAAQLNGRAVVRFDGVNDHLFNQSGPANDTANLTLLVVFRATSTADYARVVVIGPNGSGDDYRSIDKAVIDTGYAAAPSPSWRWNSGTEFECAASISVGRPTPWGVYTARMESRKLRIDRNGGVISASDDGTTNAGGAAGLLLGCQYGGGAILPTSVPFAGDIAEIIYFSRPLSLSMLGLVTELLRLRYGL